VGWPGSAITGERADNQIRHNGIELPETTRPPLLHDTAHLRRERQPNDTWHRQSWAECPGPRARNLQPLQSRVCGEGLFARDNETRSRAPCVVTNAGIVAFGSQKRDDNLWQKAVAIIPLS